MILINLDKISILEEKNIYTHAEVSPSEVNIPETDAHDNEKRANCVNQREIPSTLLVPIGGQPQPDYFHQETRPNYRDVPSRSHGRGEKKYSLEYFF